MLRYHISAYMNFVVSFLLNIKGLWVGHTKLLHKLEYESLKDYRWIFSNLMLLIWRKAIDKFNFLKGEKCIYVCFLLKMINTRFRNIPPKFWKFLQVH